MSEEHSITRGTGERRSGIDLDELFDLLSTKRRRYALYCFHEASRSELPLNALTERVERLEREASGDCGGRQEIQVALQHAHLPKLAEASVVEYDADEDVVEFRGGGRLEEWVEKAASVELDDEATAELGDEAQ